MFQRLIVFKIVFFVLVMVSAFGVAIYDGVDRSLKTHNPKISGFEKPTVSVRDFRYPLPLGFGCAVVALLVACSDVWVAERRKGTLPTYSDEEFVAKFGGNLDAQPPSQ